MNPDRHSLSRIRRQLLVLWSLGSLTALLSLIGQTAFHVYESPRDALGWLLPLVMPTLSFIVGVISSEAVMDKSAPAREDKLVDPFFHMFTLALSALYLLAVEIVILAAVRVEARPIEWLHNADIFLGPVQGLVGVALGVLFVKK
jgi:hypothetical protein